jgi:subtilisin-like proprotein convertase family protein
MKKTILTLIILFSVTFFYAQKENNSWKEVENLEIKTSEKLRRSTLPTEYKLFTFDYSKFITQLNNVPNRENFTGTSNVIVSIPSPNGEMVSYRIIEASTFEKSLQAQFPEIRSFAGNAVNDASTVIRFSISPYNGLSAIIRTATGETTYIIDPITMDNKIFIVFDRSKSKKADGSFICTTEDDITTFGPNLNKGTVNQMLNNADDGKLRKFQMAQSCTAEYSNFFGATSAAQVNLVLAAFNNTYTRCNAIFEMDFNCTMELIPNTTSVIYYNPATDPYSPSTNLGNWNTELGNTLQSVIGNDNYDIGHVFGDSGGGGNAGCIGCVCSATNAKGRAYTSPSDGNPQGDFFDVDYVAHEIGHQLGGYHTFSHDGGQDNAVNVEPGSGVTIMGYAGITGATDVASNSIPIFHAGSIKQITDNIKGKDCSGPNTGYCLEIVNTGNAVPNPSAPATKTLPIGTAFKLSGTATDADAGDVLSYCWEQVDDATTALGAPNTYPSGTKTNGANFRSFMPKNNGTRYFPRLEDHVANGVAGNQWEIVPTINRTLNFRMTVRDNRAGGGNNESVNTAVSFNTAYGPFLITSQNTSGLSYTQGSTQTVTWSVNNTTALTGAANVNIKLSTDGGLTYPITLVANTPNDGSQTVTIPNVSAPFCRILIEPTANDFYAINTSDFAIGYTVTSICNDYTRTLTTGNVITDQNPLAYQNFVLNIPLNAIITDVNVSSNITHSRRNQLYTAINSPAGTFVQLFTAGGCNNSISDLTGTWDSQSVTAAGCGVSGNFGTMRPTGDLNTLNGQNAQGNWFFRVADITAGRDGTLNSFTFRICYNQIEEAPNACGVLTTTWNGSTWSNGMPLKNVVAIFNSNYTSTGDIEACSVIVNTGANVTIASAHTLIVGNEVTVNGTGTLTVENNAALRQINGEAVNTGNIIVRKNSEPMIRQDYTAWSSPVAAQQLQSFSPNTLPNRFYEYLYTGTTTPTAYQSVTPTTNFLTGKGYMIRSADNSSPTVPAVHAGQYTGVPFNGDLSISLGKGYNLLGNPYASPIDADRFLYDNETTIGALYFWTHTVPASGGVYPVNNFASYTTLGGTASAAGGVTPNGKIQTGQGFYVRTFDFGVANFSNFQRLNASTSTQFYRTEEAQEVEKHRIWLNLNDVNNNYNQILIGYMDGATNAVDNMIDGLILDDSNSVIYSTINSDKYVIQGKSLPFSDEDIVPLGFKAVTAGVYSLSLENIDGLFIAQDVFLKDMYTNILHDIKQSEYQFSTQEGTFDDRFELVYKSGVLSSNDVINSNDVLVYTQNNQIQISSSKENILSVSIFDVLGRTIFINENIGEKAISINSISANNQALFIKVKLITGEIITKKVIF